ncbi:MAG: sulfur carrier protein ThiS [Spiribacter sp.]|nr:sulfur carrier protein ThiS [Spiribacter sp.]
MTTDASDDTLIVNGQVHSVPAAATVKALLDELGMADQRLAVEVNEAVIPRSEYATTPLQAGDRIEVIRAIGGG